MESPCQCCGEGELIKVPALLSGRKLPLSFHPDEAKITLIPKPAKIAHKKENYRSIYLINQMQKS